MAKQARPVDLRQLSTADVGCRHHLHRHLVPAEDLVRSGLVRDEEKQCVSALGLQRLLGLGSYETAWGWLHKLRPVP
jgi:hypothetical protein